MLLSPRAGLDCFNHSFPSAKALGYFSVPRGSTAQHARNKKEAAGSCDPAASNLQTYVCLIFNLNSLNHASLASARVIHAHLLTRSQRSCHDLARAIDNASCSAKREPNWTAALVFDDDCLTRLVFSDRASRVGRTGGRSRCRCGCLFSCGCGRLRKCKRRDGSTS